MIQKVKVSIDMISYMIDQIITEIKGWIEMHTKANYFDFNMINDTLNKYCDILLNIIYSIKTFVIK